MSDAVFFRGSPGALDIVEPLIIAAALIAWLQWRRAWPPCFHASIALLSLALIVETATLFTPDDVDNTWIYAIYLPLDIGLTVLLIVRSMRWRRGGLSGVLAGALFGVGCIIELLIRKDPTSSIASVALILAFLGISVLLVRSLFELARSSTKPLQQEPAFWLLSGQLVYCVGMIPYNGVIDDLCVSEPQLAVRLLIINLILASIRYASMGVSVWVASRSKAWKQQQWS